MNSDEHAMLNIVVIKKVQICRARVAMVNYRGKSRFKRAFKESECTKLILLKEHEQ